MLPDLAKSRQSGKKVLPEMAKSRQSGKKVPKWRKRVPRVSKATLCVPTTQAWAPLPVFKKVGSIALLKLTYYNL